jgi:alpha 1,2-mannosyltransferase
MSRTMSRDRPRGAIVYLSRSTADDLHDLRRSLWNLDRFFNRRHGYPVVIFHEDFSPALMAEIRRWTSSTLEFAVVDFRLPEFVNPADVPPRILGRFPIGYRHMCRFFAGMVYRHPAMQQYDWYWRFDTDSFLRCSVGYDPFEAMERGQHLYGYITLLKERPEVVQGLWETSRRYATENGLDLARLGSLTDERGGYNLLYYYNNFEIVDLRFFRSPTYLRFFDYLDRTGGIYQFRWGDAPIRTIAVALLVPPAQVRRFDDIGYSHAGYYTQRRHYVTDRAQAAIVKLLRPLRAFNSIRR